MEKFWIDTVGFGVEKKDFDIEHAQGVWDWFQDTMDAEAKLMLGESLYQIAIPMVGKSLRKLTCGTRTSTLQP